MAVCFSPTSALTPRPALACPPGTRSRTATHGASEAAAQCVDSGHLPCGDPGDLLHHPVREGRPAAGLRRFLRSGPCGLQHLFPVQCSACRDRTSTGLNCSAPSCEATSSGGRRTAVPERLLAAAFAPPAQVPCRAPDMCAPPRCGTVHILGMGGFRPSAGLGKGLCCCTDVPDPGGLSLLDTDGYGERIFRPSPGASLEGIGRVLCPVGQAVGPALLRLRRTYAPAGSAPRGPGIRRHRVRCRMVF